MFLFLSILAFFSQSIYITDSFLFPDMAFHGQRRSGGSARYVVAVLEEEPYLYEDGTGFLPDLMNLLAARYRQLKNGTIDFNYEVIPVKTWPELWTRANSQRAQIVFGLVCPHVMRADERYNAMRISQPVVHTTVKLITGNPARNSFSHRSQTSRSHVSNLIKMRGTPEESLLPDVSDGRNVYQDVETFANGLEYIRHHADDYLLSDASVADCVVSHDYENSLQSVCPSGRPAHAGNLYYGFFGKNATDRKSVV